MAIKSYKPYTPSRRYMTGLDSSDITAKASVPSLLKKLPRSAGRNMYGTSSSYSSASKKSKWNSKPSAFKQKVRSKRRTSNWIKLTARKLFNRVSLNKEENGLAHFADENGM